MSQQDNQTSGRLPVSAGLILGLLCFLWGVQSVSIKFSNQGMPPPCVLWLPESWYGPMPE